MSGAAYDELGVNYTDFRQADPRDLRADLASGRWDERHGHLRTLPELDIGLRLICEEL